MPCGETSCLDIGGRVRGAIGPRLVWRLTVRDPVGTTVYAGERGSERGRRVAGLLHPARPPRCGHYRVTLTIEDPDGDNFTRTRTVVRRRLCSCRGPGGNDAAPVRRALSPAATGGRDGRRRRPGPLPRRVMRLTGAREIADLRLSPAIGGLAADLAAVARLRLGLDRDPVRPRTRPQVAAALGLGGARLEEMVAALEDDVLLALRRPGPAPAGGGT